MKAPSRFATLAALALSTACTVHGVDVPPLSGPSELALSVAVTATPDMLPQDGASQSAIVVLVKGPDGKAISGQPLRIETAVGGAIQDYGLLSGRTAVTNADGRATVIYTAPPPSPSLSGGGTIVTIGVTPVGSNYQAANTTTADIRLMPPGVVLPPASTPVARFTVSPTPVNAGTTVYFDGSASCASQTACSSTAGITGFSWNFGDGSSGSGQTTTHAFTGPGSYTVSLTVTNDRGLSHTVTQTVSVSASPDPQAGFVYSPTTVRAGVPVYFNGDLSKASTGRTLVQYNWNFADGSVASGLTVTHTFAAAGTYNVVLSILDDAGGKAVTNQAITVLP